MSGLGDDAVLHRTHHPGMTLPPDKTPRHKLTPEERRARQADRLVIIRLKMMIGQALDDRGITDPAAIGAALGLPAGEATKLLTRHQWREGDVAQLQAAAARLELQVPPMSEFEARLRLRHKE
jgi:hypothetical protein